MLLSFDWESFIRDLGAGHRYAPGAAPDWQDRVMLWLGGLDLNPAVIGLGVAFPVILLVAHHYARSYRAARGALRRHSPLSEDTPPIAPSSRAGQPTARSGAPGQSRSRRM